MHKTSSYHWRGNQTNSDGSWRRISGQWTNNQESPSSDSQRRNKIPGGETAIFKVECKEFVVHPYVPLVRRCTECNRLGHLKVQCRSGAQVCPSCGGQDNSSSKCNSSQSASAAEALTRRPFRAVPSRSNTDSEQDPVWDLYPILGSPQNSQNRTWK